MILKMLGYFRYLPSKKFTNPFKITVLNGGFAKTPPGTSYPDVKHPEHHYFNYEKGRILNEYQILYLVSGRGKLETESAGLIDLNEGDLFFLFPGEWHRYKPDELTGWHEYWIGFISDFSDFFENNNLVSRKSPLLKIGFDDKVLDLYKQIIELLKNYNLGANYLISGVATHLLGYLLAQQKRIMLGFSEHVNDLINKAKLTIAEQQNIRLSPEEIAQKLNISYSWFRRVFKKYTGFSPKEYQIEIKLAMAKNQLLSSVKPIKEISYDSGFNSQYHFSKIFKERNSVSPADYRKNKKIIEN